MTRVWEFALMVFAYLCVLTFVCIVAFALYSPETRHELDARLSLDKAALTGAFRRP